MTVLGAGDNRVWVASRDTATLIAPLRPSRIEWGRELCGVSAASVTLSPSRCTPRLRNVHPWAHSLVVFRNGRRVWSGPIARRVDTVAGLTLTAGDALRWAGRRPIQTARLIHGSAVVTEMEWALDQAYASDPVGVTVDPLGPTGGVMDVEVAAGEKYALDLLTDAIASGGRFTALGGRLMVWDTTHSIGSTLEIIPEDHLLADVEVIEDGDETATEVTARNDDGVVAVQAAAGGAVDPYYGHVGLIVPSAAARPAGVARTAAASVARYYPAPVTIAIPNDAALRCDAPFPISRLVPGVTVPVRTTTATGRTLTAAMILSSVKVTQDEGGQEQVTISLTTGVEAP